MSSERYGLCENDFYAILNILEAHGESFQSLVEREDRNGFCGLVKMSDELDDTYKIAMALLECNAFYPNYEAYMENCVSKDMAMNELLNSIADGSVVKTTGGYVEINIV